mgnify:CR=1 FL=1
MSSGDPVSKSGCTAASAARLALPIALALGLSAPRRLGLSLRILRLSFVSLRPSVGALNGCNPCSSVTSLMRSYNAPKVWYGVGRPFTIGAGVSLLLVVRRWQISWQSSSASPARAVVGPGVLRSGRRRAFDALARARRRVVARPRAVGRAAAVAAQ